MKRTLTRWSTVLLFVSFFCLPVSAQDLTEAQWTLDETPTTVSQIAPTPLLQIPEPLAQLFPFLKSLLKDINIGRNNGDADTLLQAVQQITQALSLGGISNDSVNTDDLLEEATQIAWEQRDPVALRESLNLWSDPIRAGRNQDKIEQTQERLEQVEQDRSDMLKRKRCRLVFHNRTDRQVKVYINRKPVGTLAPGRTQVIPDLLAGRQHLGAKHTSLQWGPRQVYIGPGEVFNWRLFD